MNESHSARQTMPSKSTGQLKWYERHKRLHIYLTLTIWMIAGAAPGLIAAVFAGEFLYPHFQSEPVAAVIVVVFLLIAVVVGLLGLLFGAMVGLFFLVAIKYIEGEKIPPAIHHNS